MRAVVLAYHNMGCTGLEALLRNGFDVAAVFTHRDDPQENCWFRSVAELAASHNIPVYAAEDINHPIWVKRIADLKPDILFSCFYRNMIKPELLAVPLQGCLNLHASLLPKYRGRCPINWVLVNGERETGVTLHYMTPKPDDGDIVMQMVIPISDDDTAKSLNEKSCAASAVLLDEALPQIRNKTAARTPQDHSQSSYFGGRRPADGQIDWTKSAGQVRNLVRAVTRPWPGAFSFLRDRKCMFWSVAKLDSDEQIAEPGTVISVSPLTIACGTGSIQVELAESEGPPVSGVQLARDLNILHRQKM